MVLNTIRETYQPYHLSAEQRGIHAQPGCADELRRIIYQEMSLKGQDAEACKP